MKRLNTIAIFLALFWSAIAANAQTARLQVIHNSADAAAAVVDVWLNNTKLIENFAFRTATPFIDAPAGVLLNIGIAPPNSTSWTQSFRIKQVVLTVNETYVVVAGGIISTSGYTPSPLFRVDVYPIGREAASQPGNTDILVLHGSTDAPTVDIYETGVGLGEIVNDLIYGNVAGYLELATDNYIIEVRDETGTVTVASYQAPLSALGLEGQALSVLASGFLNPANNSNGPAFGLYVALPSGGDLIELPAYTPSTTARLQVIHNAADPAAAIVDVYLNGALTLDDFAFRTATPFIDAPAGVPINIGVAPGNSTSVNDTIKNFTVTLDAGQKYVAIANGVLNPSAFESNPDGRSTGFTLFVKTMAREEGSGGNVEFAVVHGATDAPTVDVAARGVATLVDNAAYGDITEYIAVPPGVYTLDVMDSSASVTVASFAADLSGLANGAAIVFASGFLNPVANEIGPLFGIFAALPNGTVVEFPVATARLQVIHNSADPAAQEVDVYLNGSLLLDNFAFRTATPFVDVPALLGLNIGIAPGNSTSFSDVLATFVVSLDEEGTYVAIANGVLAPSSFAFNPDGRSTAFTLFVKTMARESGSGGNVEFAAVHGATDAPAVDVVARGVATLVDNAAYGDITDYIAVPPASYILDVKDSSGSVTVASFRADLSGLANGAAIVFASGFLNPVTNQLGNLFGLYAALPNGAVVEFPVTTSRLQVIHNAADPAAAEVDIYVNGQKLLDNFAFRTATPFIDVPSRLGLNIGVAPGTSASFADTLTSFTVNLDEDEKYVAIANGVLNPADFAPNPDGRSTGFTLFVKSMARESGSGGNVEFAALHGATDAPTVDVVARGVATLVDNAAYGDLTDYIAVPPASYILDVQDSSGTVTVASFEADLSGLANGAAIVFASGFLHPDANQNGQPFGLYAALANGTVVGFTTPTSVAASQETPVEFKIGQNFPNPFNPSTTIRYELPVSGPVTLKVLNIIGQEIATLVDGQQPAGVYDVVFPAANLPSGVYFYTLRAGGFSDTKRMILMR